MPGLSSYTQLPKQNLWEKLDLPHLTVQDTGLDYSTFPADCPYTLPQILDQTFFPNL